MKAPLEQELERLEKEGIITPVPFSEWTAPIVLIVKSDGSVRVCKDYKCTINQASKLDNYPIPKTEDPLTTLGGMSQGHVPSLPAIVVRRRVQTIHHNEHTQGLIPVQPSTIWGVISTENIPTNNGQPIAWHTLCYCTG